MPKRDIGQSQNPKAISSRHPCGSPLRFGPKKSTINQQSKLHQDDRAKLNKNTGQKSPTHRAKGWAKFTVQNLPGKSTNPPGKRPDKIPGKRQGKNHQAKEAKDWAKDRAKLTGKKHQPTGQEDRAKDRAKAPTPTRPNKGKLQK